MSPVPSRRRGPHQAQTALAYSPFQPSPPPPTESLSDRAAFILAYCISLYASSRWAVNAYTYRQEKQISNLIHSGSSYNIRAAQPVCPLVSELSFEKCCDF